MSPNLIATKHFKYKDLIKVIISKINIIRMSTTTHKCQKHILKYGKITGNRKFKYYLKIR